ncbi:hypothetical protein CP532_0101 [Ophiocordyceps camponoti-leonardi (nom. inval.)]|nr:hypothetical protein CP532_0101 [Ophiocordyceps camponoti-leonardi (nom. inval.)]
MDSRTPLPWALSMLTALTGYLGSLRFVDDHGGEEVGVGADDLARHGRLGDVEERFAAQVLHLDADIFVEELDGLAQRQTVAGDDGGGMYPVLHQLVAPTQQFGGDEDDRSGAVADLFVLLLRQVDEDLTGGIFDVEEAEDGGAVVGCRFAAAQTWTP